MKNNYKFWICLILALFLLSGLFYWFQWRPTEIVKNCHSYAVEQAVKDSENNDKTFKDEDYKFRLQYCYHKEGLR